MSETDYNVKGNPGLTLDGVSQEIFTTEELLAIQTCAANIDAIVNVSINGLEWATSAQEGANAAALSATEAGQARDEAVAAAASIGTSVSDAQAAAASATASAATASAASADAIAAAQQAQAALDDIGNNPGMIPPGGEPGQVLTKETVEDYDTIWDNVTKATTDLSDWSGEAPAHGDVPTWNDSSGVWEPNSSIAPTEFVDLADVSVTTVEVGQSPIWRDTGGGLLKLVNEFPAGSTADSGIVKQLAGLVGPASVAFSTALAGSRRYTPCDITAGNVDINIDGTLTHASDEAIEAYFQTLGLAAPVGKLRFLAGLIADAVPVKVGTVAVINRGSGVGGTPINSAAMNATVNVTVPAGNNMAVAIIHGVNPASGSAPAISPGYKLASVDYDWALSLEFLEAKPRLYVKIHALGDLASPTVYTYQSRWTDYGASVGNAASILTQLIPLSGVHQSASIAAFKLDHLGVASVDNTISVALPASAVNTLTILGAHRRGNQPSSTGTPLTFHASSAVTLIQELLSDNTYGTAASRMISGSKTGAPGTTVSAIIPGNAATPNNMSGFALAINPTQSGINMYRQGVLAPQSLVEITDVNHLIGLLYDKHANAVYVTL